MKIYFDANIWIDYIWREKEGDSLKKETQDLIDFIENKKNKMSVITSIFLFSEITEHFKDWYILNKIIKNGFGYRDLPNLKKRKEYRDLTHIQNQKIESYFEDISDLEWVDSVELDQLSKEALDLFSRLTLTYHLDFADAFHIVIAMGENCSCLITRDGPLRENMNIFLKESNLEEDFRVYRPKEFLNLYKKP